MALLQNFLLWSSEVWEQNLKPERYHSRALSLQEGETSQTQAEAYTQQKHTGKLTQVDKNSVIHTYPTTMNS